MELNKIYCMDVLQGLKQLDSESIDCCVTSPPYWGLRDYGIEGNIWDAQEGCEHQWEEVIRPSNKYDGKPTPGTTGKQSIKGESNFAFVPETKSNFCIKCNAWKGQLGLEPTPELYVKHIVDVFREVKRVLKKSGTAWLNLGDSYCGGGSKTSEGSKQKTNKGAIWEGQDNIALLKSKIPGIKPKDLVGIPWSVAFALRDDGWWLRQDIIWSKGNPMPESITDRCTKSHEYIFLLAKSQTYYFDNESIKEKATTEPHKFGWNEETYQNIQSKNTRWDRNEKIIAEDGTRNKRSVWTIATKPFKDAHFATFPEALIEPAIKAGCPELVCKKCGAPRERVMKSIGYIENATANIIPLNDDPYAVKERTGYVAIRDLPLLDDIKNYLNEWRKIKGYSIEQIEENLCSQSPHHWFSGESYPTKDDWIDIKNLLNFDDRYDIVMTKETYKPAEKLTSKYKEEFIQCNCNAGFDKGVVLDPFMGAGTTALVSKYLNRNYIGFDIKQSYVDMANERLRSNPTLGDWI